jgi:hypothetical protein
MKILAILSKKLSSRRTRIDDMNTQHSIPFNQSTTQPLPSSSGSGRVQEQIDGAHDTCQQILDRESVLKTLLADEWIMTGDEIGEPNL